MSRKLCDATAPTRSPVCSVTDPMRLIYLDESKRGNRYLIASTTVDAAGAIEVRRELGHLVLPGQRRLHFKSESDRRRRELLDAIVGLSCAVRVYSVGRLAEPDARSLAPSAVVRDVQTAGGDSTVYIGRVERRPAQAAHPGRRR